ARCGGECERESETSPWRLFYKYNGGMEQLYLFGDAVVVSVDDKEVEDRVFCPLVKLFQDQQLLLFSTTSLSGFTGKRGGPLFSLCVCVCVLVSVCVLGWSVCWSVCVFVCVCVLVSVLVSVC